MEEEGESSPVSKGLELKKKKADLYLGIRDSIGTVIKIIIMEEKESHSISEKRFHDRRLKESQELERVTS